ncbi:MAG TPA: hypothetical protein DDW52_06895 [Planctomycetaceae bacterium]|nr:hypothetical protein [Planctomycetaceae bacterium]
MLTTEERNARIEAALKKCMPQVKNFSHDVGLPTRPVCHQRGIMTASQIVTGYREGHRKESLNVQPNEVVEVLERAGIKRWVLMGLYGYVGYLAMPRATQDVDILVDEDEIDAVIEAIVARWPTLQIDRQEVVVRFRDPGEIAITGEMMQVIDAMLPSNACYRAILDRHHRVDESTGHRIPVIEAACASKFAALVSPYREWERKQQDAVDLRSIMGPNAKTLEKALLQELGDLVYPDGGRELLEFLQLTIDKKPFPI